ncbi:ABC transporter permease [Leptolyngbya sp. AN03gr2]|uniref:ABC transporter permease n=1 Tax=unclassified Leptolyngbya TaxID=2650499 RepID=UPI003D320AB8
MLSRPIQSESTPFLLGFVPFFRKEIQEWKQQKQAAIAVLLLIPFLLSLAGIVLIKLAQMSGVSAIAADGDHLTLSATSTSNPLWLGVVSVLLSIGLIPNELTSGTLSWNLTKPLSRLSFLLGKWSGNVLMIWLVAVVLANVVTLLMALIGVGAGTFSIPVVLARNLFALLPIAFWVLFCLFAGMFLKDQAAIGAFALVLAAIGTGLASAQGLASTFGIQLSQNNQAWFDAIATYYPTNVIDGFLTADNTINFLKLSIYLVYMALMFVATYSMFDRKEFS